MRPRHRLVRSLYFQAMRKSILELDESVTNAIEIGQMQQTEFVAAVCRKCSRHQGVRPGDEVGASHPCEATCEQADGPGEATIQLPRECETSAK